jgi:putative glycosyltransferase (TIGR04348 family)
MFSLASAHVLADDNRGAMTARAVVAIVSPVRPQASSGNNITSLRWSSLLQRAGHEAVVVHMDEAAADMPTAARNQLDNADVLIALHARRSRSAVSWWTARHPERPVIVAMTGTDLYVDLPHDISARASTESADALITLQRAAEERLGSMKALWGAKATTIHQSVAGPHLPRDLSDNVMNIVVLAHLRPVKDPLLTARAARHLPPESRVMVHHAGGPMDAELTKEAIVEHETNARYQWHRELNRPDVQRLLASAHALACTSISEGGANVVSEAIAMGIPVIGTRIDGNVGLVGQDHPGLIPVGDERALAQLLVNMERDPALMEALQQRTDELQPMTQPDAEQKALAALVAEVLEARRVS